jgi:hypothetical protein
MSGSIKARQAALFGTIDYVCGGHGARRPSHGTFTVPAGITIYFYVPDGTSLSNTIGQKVDQILTGGTAPAPTEVVAAGTVVHDYHLYSSKAGGYLNLGMSSSGNARYITTADKENGIALSTIVADIVKLSPFARIHWSACRSLENDGDTFGWSKPEYSTALQSLGGTP